MIYIAKMNLEYFLLFSKIINGFQHVLAHQRTALKPAANTEAYPDIGAVGNFHGLFITIKIAEYTTGYTGEFRYRRIIRMYADIDTFLFCHGGSLLYKILIIGPYLICRICPFMAQRGRVPDTVPMPGANPTVSVPA